MSLQPREPVIGTLLRELGAKTADEVLHEFDFTCEEASVASASGWFSLTLRLESLYNGTVLLRISRAELPPIL